MPTLSFELDWTGRPLVELYATEGTIDGSAVGGLGLPPAAALRIVALIDTGASRSHVDLSILEQLGLLAVGFVGVHTASTGEIPPLMGEYSVNLAFAGDRPGPLAEDLRVIGSDRLSGLKVQMLLGQDVLRGCLLACDGPNRRVSLAYDSPGATGGDRAT